MQMNQPKFKFGDKVFRRYEDGSTNTFIVRSIHEYAGDFLYAESREAREWYHELNLELYQDPKKKKLYAYTNENDEVIHIKRDKGPRVRWDDLDLIFLRDPEYDIDYPEAE